MDSTIVRTIPGGGFNMALSQSTPILPSNLNFDMRGVTSFSLQFIMTGLAGGTDGTFQLIGSNDGGTTWAPLPASTTFPSSVHISGTTQLTYIITGSGTTGFPAVSLINFTYTRAAGSGTLTKVIIGVINN